MMTHLDSMIGRNDGAMKPLYAVIFAMMTRHFSNAHRFHDSVSPPEDSYSTRFLRAPSADT